MPGTFHIIFKGFSLNLSSSDTWQLCTYSGIVTACNLLIYCLLGSWSMPIMLKFSHDLEFPKRVVCVTENYCEEDSKCDCYEEVGSY